MQQFKISMQFAYVAQVAIYTQTCIQPKVKHICTWAHSFVHIYIYVCVCVCWFQQVQGCSWLLTNIFIVCILFLMCPIRGMAALNCFPKQINSNKNVTMSPAGWVRGQQSSLYLVKLVLSVVATPFVVAAFAKVSALQQFAAYLYFSCAVIF